MPPPAMTFLLSPPRSPRLSAGALILGSLFFSLLSLTAAPLQRPHSRLYVDFSPAPKPANLLAFDLVFLDADAKAELGPGRALGHDYYARLNSVSVTPGSKAGIKAVDLGLPVTGHDSAWQDLLVDVLNPNWIPWVISQQAKPAAAQGFSGFLLDGAAALTELDRLRPDHFLPHRQAFISLVIALRREFPDKPVIIRGGFEFAGVLSRHIEGILAENVLTLDNAEVTIRKAQGHGLKIYAVEHGNPSDLLANQKAVAQLDRIGCLPFVTTPALDGTVLGPFTAQSRHTLVLHGWDTKTASRSAQAPDTTWTARTLAPALHWLDLAPRYVGVTEWLSDPASHLYPVPAGIIIDPDLILAADQQGPAAAWLARAHACQIPIVLAGQPFTEPSAWTVLASALNLSGSGQPSAAATRSSLSHYDASWFQPKQVPSTRSLRPLDLQAPAIATRLLTYRLSNIGPAAQTFDSGFLADWGGAWLDASARTPIDTFRFLESALHRETAGPVPDTTTHAGRRVYLSTVQGKGFTEPSWKIGSPFCGELLQTELEHFPNLPATIAVSEADIRGWSATSNPAEATRYETVARRLFSLPQIEPAANSFSRPLNWSDDAFQSGPLHSLIPDNRTGIEREITGSFLYLKRRLVPPGKFLRFFLWPEGAHPSQAALDHLAQTGATQLPGSWLSGWNVSPVSTPELTPQTSTSLHTPDSPEAIAATWFQTHASPTARRIAPIHLAYAFADLKKTANLEALRQIWSWCAEQPLHAMTASTYADFLRDAAAVQVFPVSDNHWRIISSGRPSTLRLPASRGLPDLTRSTGITGFTTHQGQTYIHLGSLPLSELVLQSTGNETPHLHLVDADRPLDFYELRPQTARFRTQDRDQAIVTLGGLLPGSWYQIIASGSQARLQANPAGQLTLKAPALATISIQPAPELGKPYASR
jgi:hypothetical protein